MPEMSQGAATRDGPTAVGLTRLSTRLSFPPGGEALYRSMLQLVGLSEAGEFLVFPCGRGGSALYVARSTGAGGAGADPDAAMVSAASQRARNAGWAGRLHFEQAPPGGLPYQDAVFDLTVGEMALGGLADPAAAVRELRRVTKPGGTVVLVQLVWARALAPDAREAMVDRLGVRPRMPMEWKQMLLDAGVDDLHVEDWSDPVASRDRPSVLGGLTGLFTLRGRLLVLPRAWKRWGWRGLRAAVARERELRHMLESERVLGVALIKGTRPDEIATGGIE